MNARLRARTIAALLAVLAVATAAPRARAGDAEEDRRMAAQGLFERGVKLAKDGDSKAALEAFRAAYASYPSFRVLYNIGQLCARMGDGACAVRAYEQYLRDGGADVPGKRRSAVDSEIKALRRTLALVTIKTGLSGAEVTVDGTDAGKTPLPGPVPVNAGSHEIAITHEGRTTKKSVKVVSGDEVTLDMDPAEEEEPGRTDPPPRPEESPATSAPAAPEPPRKFPVVAWAVTGGLAAVTVVTGILASGAYDDYQTKKTSFPITRQELDDAHGSARDLFLLTSALGAVTVISAGVATYMTFAGGAAPARTGARPVRVSLAPALGGLSLVGVMP